MTIADVVVALKGKLMAGDPASPRVVGAVVANDLLPATFPSSIAGMAALWEREVVRRAP